MFKYILIFTQILTLLGCSSSGVVKRYNYALSHTDKETIFFQTRFVGEFKKISESLTEKSGPYKLIVSASPKNDPDYLNCNFFIQDAQINSVDRLFSKYIIINESTTFEDGYKNGISAIYASPVNLDIPYKDHNLIINYKVTNCGEKNQSGTIHTLNKIDYEESKNSFWDFATA